MIVWQSFAIHRPITINLSRFQAIGPVTTIPIVSSSSAIIMMIRDNQPYDDYLTVEMTIGMRKRHDNRTVRASMAMMLVTVMMCPLSGCMGTAMPSPDEPPQTDGPSVMAPSKPSTTPSPEPTIIDDHADAKLDTSMEPSHWYYDNLTESQRGLHNRILSAVESFEDSIPFDDGSMPTRDDVGHVMAVITAERPELFYLDGSYSFKYHDNDPSHVSELRPKYLMGKDEWDRRMGEVKAIADPLVEDITENAATQYDAELMAHDWLVEHLDYHNDPSMKGRASYQTIYGAFHDGQANCMGYANAMLYLMQRLGMDATIVTGTATRDDGSSEAHEWNMVNLDGRWYHVDVCWDDPVTTDPNATGMGIDHGYMNVNDDQISRNHAIDDTWGIGTPPKSTGDTDAVDYYTRNGLMVKSDDGMKSLVSSHADGLMDGEPLSMRFMNDSAYGNAKSRIGDILSESLQSRIGGGDVMQYRYVTSDAMRTMSIRITK